MVILVRSGEVDFCVGTVEVAASDDGFGFFEVIQEVFELWVPRVVAKLQTREVGFAVRGVDVDEIEVREFKN